MQPSTWVVALAGSTFLSPAARISASALLLTYLGLLRAYFWWGGLAVLCLVAFIAGSVVGTMIGDSSLDGQSGGSSETAKGKRGPGLKHAAKGDFLALPSGLCFILGSRDLGSPSH